MFGKSIPPQPHDCFLKHVTYDTEKSAFNTVKGVSPNYDRNKIEPTIIPVIPARPLQKKTRRAVVAAATKTKRRKSSSTTTKRTSKKKRKRKRKK